MHHVLTACFLFNLAFADEAERRAVDYLVAEVPRWRAENECASCHHNGDGAGALYRAMALGLRVPDEAVANSTEWLLRPDSWDREHGSESFNDTRLARIQFARGLARAVEAGVVGARSALERAADLVADDQADDGSWPLDGPDSLGSPTTYGWSLATLSARDLLIAADPDRHKTRIATATDWLRSRPIRTVLDASVELLRRDDTTRPEIAARRDQAIDLLRRSISVEGGWGPYMTSPPEVFDTALAVLALSGEASDDTSELRRLGRSFLIRSQLPSGGWAETTRPSGNESLAQHTSTTAWATLALLASRSQDDEHEAEDRRPREEDRGSR